MLPSYPKVPAPLLSIRACSQSWSPIRPNLITAAKLFISRLPIFHTVNSRAIAEQPRVQEGSATISFAL